MTFVFRSHVSLILLSAMIGGCQTTGSNNWIPASQQAVAADARGSSTAVNMSTGVIGAPDGDFEKGRNPYEYDDIPPGVRPANDTREAGIWYQADKSEKAIQTSGTRIRDADLQAYLEGIVCDLAGPYCGNMRVYIQRIPVFNATMSPNGMMSIYSGFLLRTQNEAQIAAVLGHEIGHYIRRHSIQKLNDIVAKQDFNAVFGLLMATAGVPAMADVAQLASIGSIYAFSRDNEREADIIGINLMARQGYDAREASAIWRQLIREQDPERAIEEASTSAPFASTHPADRERLNTLGAIAEKIQGDDKWGTRNQDRFDTVIRPWKFRFLEDEIRLRNWRTSLALLDILEENGHDKGEILYFKGEIFRHRDRKADKTREKEEDRLADTERALSVYQNAIAQPSPPAEAFRALGLHYQRMKEPDKAREALVEYLKRVPSAPDGKMIEYTIQMLGGVQS